METNIYKQHDAAFSNVSAFVCLAKGNGMPEIRIALKFPKDGAGRLYAYVHVLGHEMVRAYAGGYGYDKRSAAVSYAFEKIAVKECKEFSGLQWYELGLVQDKKQFEALRNAFMNIGGLDWQDVLRGLGYTIHQAV